MRKGRKFLIRIVLGGGPLGPDDDGYQATIEFVRVEYDIQKAVQKTLDEADLDDFLGLRLLEGR